MKTREILKHKIGIVVSETYADITESMLVVAKKQAELLNLEIKEIIYVPGCYDMPLVIKKMLLKSDIEAVVTLGAIIEGNTDHDTIVAQNVARKIIDLSVEYNKPVSLGISGPKMTHMDALNRIDSMAKNAVNSCAKLLKINI